MSLFLLRLGNLLHLHPVALALFGRKSIAVGVAEPPDSGRRDDRPCFRSGVEETPADPHVEAGRSAPLRGDGSATARDSEFLDNLWLELP